MRKMAGFTDKVVLITGSSSGIGAATAVGFAKLGAKLVITSHNQVGLDDVAKQCLENGAPKVESVVADISTDEGIRILVNATLKKFGTIHVLVNNAGSPSRGDLQSSKGDATDMDWAYQLLLRSPWKLSGYFVDELIKNKGNIVNISSANGTYAVPPFMAYSVMKAGLNHMTKCMATELGMQGVRVNCIAPGATYTNVLRAVGIPDECSRSVFQQIASSQNVLEQKVLEPAEIAQSIVFLASEAASRITGVVLHVDGGAVLTSPAYDFAGSQSIPGLEQK